MSDYEESHRAGPSITSAANERIRYVKSLYRTSIRRKEGLFVVEGVRLLEDALDAGARPELVLVDEAQLERTPRGAALLKRLRDFEMWTVTPSVLSAITDTVTPQGVIALFRIPETPKQPDLGAVTLILDRISDPGNAGTILRSAEASGVVKTVAFVDSVDAYSPKVVRAGMGAHFRLTILEDARFADVQALLGERPIYAAASDGAALYDQVDWTKDSALVIGGEAEGAGEASLQGATEKVRIPMAPGADSINSAMATSVILFDSARARRAAGLLETAPPKERPHREPSERPPRRYQEEEEETERPPFRERPFGERSFGERPSGERPYGERPYRERPFRERPFEERPFRERPDRERPFEERPYRERPDEERPFRERPAGERPFRERPFREREGSFREDRGEERPYRDRPFRDRPFEDRPRGEKPFGNRPYGQRPYGERPSGEKPFGNRPNPPGRGGFGGGEGRPFNERGFRDRDERRPPFSERGSRDRDEGRPGGGGYRGGNFRGRDQSEGGPPRRPHGPGSPGGPSDRPFRDRQGPPNDGDDGGRVEYPRRHPRL